MSELSVSKSILAKLLASENITISHRNVQTAFFDLKNRAMTLPIWNDMDGEIYDLLVGHEIGHALYTPQQGWHDATLDNQKKSFKSFLNVIEDARIEKLVKRKYPGLGKSFAAGYKEFYERDLFGIKKLPDVNKLNLIDRINIRFKVGSHVIVKFTDAEMEFVREIQAAETWEQVEDIANRVYAYVKEKEADKINTQTDLDQLIRDNSENVSDEFRDQDEASEDSSDYDDDSFDGDMDQTDNTDEDEGNDPDSKSDQTTTGGGAEKDDGEPKSLTDNNFRQRERQLVNETGTVNVFTLPEANLKNIILDNKLVIAHLENFINKQLSSDRSRSPYVKMGMTYDKLVAKCVAKFNRNNQKYIMHILKEFEMRKRAYQYARTTQAKTGELNMDVLHNYKFSNDLFKKMNITGKAKNHGMILFLDMSGSMSDIMRNTVEQLLVLVSFCKLANIPFDVYGFSNDRYNPHYSLYACSNDGATEESTELLHILHNSKKFESEHGGMVVTRYADFHLKHLIGSDLPAAQYRKSFNALAIVTNEYYRRRVYGMSPDDLDHGSFEDWSNGGFGLNGTPTIQMLLSSRQIINDFKQKHKRDIVNVIHLTDGEGDHGVFTYPRQYATTPNRQKGVTYFVDKTTKKKIKLSGDYNSEQTAITQLVSQVTGCKHIGFRLLDNFSARSALKDMGHTVDGATLQKLRKSYKEHNFMEVSTHGYSKFFYIGASTKNIVDDELKIQSTMTKAKMASEFNKSQTGKRSNRILVSKFSEEIAA